MRRLEPFSNTERAYSHFDADEERAQPVGRDNTLTGPAISSVGLPLDGSFSFEENRRPRAARVSPLTMGKH